MLANSKTQKELDLTQKRMFKLCRGDAGAKLLIESPNDPPIHFPLDRPFTFVGSGTGVDLKLEHGDVLPIHCVLQWIEGSVFCIDLSIQDTPYSIDRVNIVGRWLNTETASIGPFRISIKSPKSISPPSMFPASRSSLTQEDQPTWGFRFEGVEQQEKVWVLDRMLTLIGRSDICKLKLNHLSLQRIHAYLLHTNQSSWLVIVPGSRMLLLNGKSTMLAPLALGDQIQLGPFQAQVVPVILRSNQKAIPATDSNQRTNVNRSEGVAITHGQPSGLSVSDLPSPLIDAEARIIIQQQQSEITRINARLEQLQKMYIQLAQRYLSKHRKAKSKRRIIDVNSDHSVPIAIEQEMRTLESSEIKRPSLHVIKGLQQGDDFELGDLPVKIGRDKRNEFRIFDAEMSRHHATVTRVKTSYFLTDCNSANGTFVNGTSIRSIQLVDGDQIQLGGTLLYFSDRSVNAPRQRGLSHLPDDSSQIIAPTGNEVIEQQLPPKELINEPGRNQITIQMTSSSSLKIATRNLAPGEPLAPKREAIDDIFCSGIFHFCRCCQRDLRISQRHLGYLVECKFCQAKIELNPGSQEVLKADCYTSCSNCQTIIRFPSSAIEKTISCPECHKRAVVRRQP